MRTETFKKRAEVIYTKKGEISIRYERSVSYLRRLAAGEKIFPYRWSHNGRHHTLYGENHADGLSLICRKIGVKLESGNDKKGGMESTYFFLPAKERAKLKDVDFDNLNKKYNSENKF